MFKRKAESNIQIIRSMANIYPQYMLPSKSPKCRELEPDILPVCAFFHLQSFVYIYQCL